MTAADLPLDYQVEPWHVPGVASDQWESHPALDPRTGDLWFTRRDRSFSGWHLMTSRRTADGWLYFGSRRAGGLGKNDIWRARQEADGSWHVENAGAAINSAGSEYEFLPSPDGTWALLATDQGFFRVACGPHGWEPRQRLGPAVNANSSEIGPMFLPDGQSFLFSRDAGDNRSGELFLAYRGEWPDWHQQFDRLVETARRAPDDPMR